jgi:SAM-dependent methyltransferase
VTPAEARALLSPAITTRGGVWADFGAGEGTFTRALAELLGPDSRIIAVDRDASAVAALDRWASTASAIVLPVRGDFSFSFDPPDATRFDGMLFANSLHYVRNAGEVLARLVAWLKPSGRVVFVEYDRERANQWVPFPISIDALSTLTDAAALSVPTVVARRPSMYQGELYVAIADRNQTRPIP